MMEYNRKLILEDGTEYPGYGFGSSGGNVCEIVFNTSMVGYQEIVSDPSYTNQMVVMTYPIIGSYGIADEDYESKLISVGGLVVRDYNDMPSNFRYTKTLSELLEENNIPGISGVDTRKLSRFIRDNGTTRAIITDISVSKEEGLALIRAAETFTDTVSRVSCKKRWYSRTSDHKFNVAAIDCGMTFSIVRSLNQNGCNVTIVPYNTTAEDIEFMHPDGVLISNGPGNPEHVAEVIETVRKLKGKLPVFGIGLGHEIIALAYGAKTYKLKFGHYGSSHPVQNVLTGRIEVTAQNHIYAVDEKSLKGTGLEVTHRDVTDGTVEGLRCSKDRMFSVQYIPENVPGPAESPSLYEMFIDAMKEGKQNA